MAFKPGNNANPKGRPVGAKDKRTELRELLKLHAPALIEKAVQLALDGDTTALRLCVDRIIPPIKAIEEPVKLEGFDGTLPDKGQAILCAMAEGKLASSQTASLLQALAAQTRIIEAAECVREAQRLYYRVDTRGKVGGDEKGRGWMDAAELRRHLEDDSLPANERRVYMHQLQHKTDDEVERQMIQAKLTQMGWEEVKELRRRAEEKGVSKRLRETLLKVADANERVLRMGEGGDRYHPTETTKLRHEIAIPGVYRVQIADSGYNKRYSWM